MNKIALYASLFAMFLFLLPFSAFAKSNHKNFSLTNSATIGTTQLNPGRYEVKWSGTGNEIHISILQKGKTLATASGSMVEQQSASPYSGVDTVKDSSNTSVIRGFQFANQKEELMVKRDTGA